MPLMRLLRALLVVALWREARGANIDALLKKAESVDVDALAARAEQGLGIVRRSVGGALSWARAHRQVVSAAAGGGLLFYGKNVGHVLLLAQTFRVTGWPTVKKGTAELVTSYEEASTVIEDEAPNLLAARASLQDVQKKSTAIQATVAKAQASFASGRMTKAALAATVAEAKAQMKDVMQQASAAAAALSTVSRVAQVVDPERLQDVFVAMWQAAAACIASVTSRTAASISTGLSLGTDLAAAARGVLLPLVALVRRWLASAQTEAEDALRGATSALPPHVQKWISLALNGASRAVTVYLGYIYRETALVLSGCVLGARLLADGIASGASALVERASGGEPVVITLPSWLLGGREIDVQAQAAGAAGVLATPLAFWGFASQQLTPGGGRLPAPARFLGAPVLALDRYLQALSLNIIKATGR